MAATLVVGQVHQHPSLQLPCAGADACLPYQVNAEVARALRDHGVSLDLYAWLVTGSAVVNGMALFGLAWVVKRGANRELLPVLVAWIFPALGATLHFRDATVFEVGWFSPLAFTAFAVNQLSFIPVVALFPNGRFVPRWTRWLVVVMVPIGLVKVILAAGDARVPGPMAAAVGVATFVTYAVLLGAQLYRYRRSDSIARRQSRWVVAGLGAMIVLALVIIAGSTVAAAPDEGSWLEVLLELATASFVLILFMTLAVAVVRFRLWGVEVVLNRLLVWGALSTGVLAVYLVAIGTTSLMFDAADTGPPAVLAAIIIAIAFQPARRRLQRFADRAVYGSRDEPVAITADMGELFDDLTRPDLLLSALARLIATDLKLSSVTLAVQLTDGTTVEETHGQPGAGERHTIALRVGPNQIGNLTISSRRGQRQLAKKDRHTLNLIGSQAAALAGMLRLAHERELMRDHVVVARDEERRRLRRDLHDGLGPTLASISQRVDAAAKHPTTTLEVTHLLEDANVGLRETLVEMRRIVQGLRPPLLDQAGLMGALRRSIERDGSDVSSPTVSVSSDDDFGGLGDSVELALLRIAEEAVLNARRHASATHIEVSLARVDDHIVLQVSDDGTGIASDAVHGVGMRSMHERAAELGGRVDVTDASGCGTSVTVRLPARNTR